MHLNHFDPNSRCGYCKNKKENAGSASWGIGAPRLSVADYEILKD